MQRRRVSGSFYGASPKVPGAGALSCADLYAGAGGFSLSAMNIGLRVKAAVEWNAHASQTYRGNLVQSGWPHLYSDDIRSISPNELKAKSFGADQQCDIVLGGPPCQGFSAHRIKDAGVNDPRNELILRYFEFVRILAPKVFLMENVPGMLWPRHQKYLEAFKREASLAGYNLMEPVVIDARDYGVPQRRKRVFILGQRKDVKLDLNWPPKGRHMSKSAAKQSGTQKEEWRMAADIFNTAAPLGDENEIHMNHGPELIKAFKATPINGGSRRDSGRVLPCHKGHDGHKDVYGRIDPSQPGPTMTTACINPSKGRFVHPTKNHGITVRQAARFQTFPDTYRFSGGLTAAGEQIGNAVPILLGEALLTEIVKALLINQ